MSQPEFNPFDPVSAAMGALHQGNLLAAKEARIRQLEQRLETVREAGDALAYCLRHPSMVDPKEVLDATRDWQDARNHV